MPVVQNLVMYTHVSQLFGKANKNNRKDMIVEYHRRRSNCLQKRFFNLDRSQSKLSNAPHRDPIGLLKPGGKEWVAKAEATVIIAMGLFYFVSNSKQSK